MSPSVVAVCVQGLSHLRTMLPVVSSLRERGLEAEVMTRANLRGEVERTGAGFIDLFDGYPVEAVDDSSLPVPSRFVTFAGAYGERLAADVAELSPDLILYETFSVVGPVIARSLEVPYVNVVANHAPVPERMLALLREDPRVSTSPACEAAIERLRTVHGIEDAGPFYYYEALSPHLNLYPEPRQFLDEADREAFAPLAFFGSLAPDLYRRAERGVFRMPGARRRVLASFGTIIWLYWATEALAAFGAMSRACAELPDVELVISLGGRQIDPVARQALERPNVQVVEYVDQWTALAEADAFVTHHGLNSTHEAIYHEVPMISYPFFGDQPALAARCQDLGLAVPLADEPIAEVTERSFASALTRLDREHPGLEAGLAQARSWELETIAGRGEAVDRIVGLLA